MGTKKGYRVSGRFKEILDVLVRARREGKNQLWRSSRRKLTPIRILDLNPEGNWIEIELLGPVESPLKVGDQVFLKLEIRDSAFKTEVESSGSRVRLLFPEEIALSENRSEGRVYFHPTDGKQVLVRKVKEAGMSVASRTYSPVVGDICRTGMALILSPQQSHSIQLGERLSVEMLGPFRIHPPIHGEVVFKIDHQSRGVLGGLELGAKVGVHLERKIPEQTYQLFCLRESAFQVDDKQIVRDQAFRRDVHDRMGAILKQVSRRKHLIKVMQKLDLGSQKAPYLKKHIELLCEVMCGLGTSLGWVSSATMDKLIYVAYLHDARYFPYPALARIPNLAEFDRVKSSLTKEEQAAYLEGPAYAAELARQDSESHPDASRILLQQKELPDGSGFPGKITTQSFIPLSCLFIASHAFVDYVLEHPDWTVDDFIRSNQRVLRGQYFQKIFQAMRS